MTNWNEIDIDLFKDVFKAYFNHEGNLDDKVLEVQNLNSIYHDSPDVRVFFGSGIEIKDYVKWNTNALAISDALEHVFGSFPNFRRLEDCEISMCIFEQGPIIIPIGSSPGHDNIILASYFGIEFPIDDNNAKVANIIKSIEKERRNKSMYLYYYYCNNGIDKKYYISSSKDNLGDEFIKKVRVRTMTLNEWKQLTKNYITSNYKLPDEIFKGDVDKDSIIKVDK